MSIAKQPSKELTPVDHASHDAARVGRSPRPDEESAANATAGAHEALDSRGQDPYDNVACTD
jgi:hypothetical protein